jgi:hypothetical protein
MVFSASGAVKERRRNGPTYLLNEDLLREERYDNESRSGVCVYTCRSRLPHISSLTLFLRHLAPPPPFQRRRTQDKQDHDDAIQIYITFADSTIQCRYVPQTPASPPMQAVRRKKRQTNTGNITTGVCKLYRTVQELRWPARHRLLCPRGMLITMIMVMMMMMTMTCALKY